MTTTLQVIILMYILTKFGEFNDFIKKLKISFSFHHKIENNSMKISSNRMFNENMNLIPFSFIWLCYR